MSGLGMEGPFNFTAGDIDRTVARVSPGNYALGKADNPQVFTISYIGRADADVNRELKLRLNPAYAKFKFSYAASTREAFEKECRNFHDYGGSDNLDNPSHPDRPMNTDWKCPTCKIFG